jgi:uncharacterized Zn finger protein
MTVLDGQRLGRGDLDLACNDCGAEGLVVVADGDLVDFRCPACGACWHMELGWVRRVDLSR